MPEPSASFSFVRVLFFAAVLSFAAAPGARTVAARGDLPSPGLELRGVIESGAAVGLADGRLQKSDIVLMPEMRLRPGNGLRLVAIGRIRFDPVDRLEPGRPARQNATRSILARRLFIGRGIDLELREFYLDLDVGSVFLRLGRQQIVWGQADGLRVLDVVNPFDFREFILPEFEDRRIPLWTVDVEVPVGEWMLQLVWIPDHTYDDVPAPGATFAFSSPLVVPGDARAAPDGPAPVVKPPRRPGRFIRDDDYGARLTAFVGGWDLSLNYLYHYQDQAVPFRQRTAASGIVVVPRYRRTHLIGGSFSNAFGPFTVRGEFGYSTSRHFLVRNPADEDGVVESGELGYVLGLDYQHDADLRISGQLFQSLLTGAASGTVRDRLETRATLLVERELLNDRLVARLLAIGSLNDGDGVVQADLAYEYRSGVVLKFGLDLFYGGRDGLFGEFRNVDRLSFGVEVGF